MKQLAGVRHSSRTLAFLTRMLPSYWERASELPETGTVWARELPLDPAEDIAYTECVSMLLTACVVASSWQAQLGMRRDPER